MRNPSTESAKRRVKKALMVAGAALTLAAAALPAGASAQGKPAGHGVGHKVG
jgi:hypothetical protein